MEDCIEWKGSFWNHGYGYIYWNGRDDLAHRVIHEIVHGPTTGFHVLHACDNKKCVNPRHLYLGNNPQNVQDREDRKRSGRWWDISEFQKQQVRALKGAMSQARIAKVIGVSQSTVARWIDG